MTGMSDATGVEKQVGQQTLCVISERGLQSLMTAGISTGWLKAWLFSAGASSVLIALLESELWQHSNVEYQLFFTADDELKAVMRQHGLSSTAQHDACFRLDNPPRNCWRYVNDGRQIMLLSPGDIACQRQRWLTLFNGGKALLPLYVRADDTLPWPLEPGLSASLSQPADGCFLNAVGQLIEEQAIASLKQHQRSIRTVESCTAGGIAARLCRVPGASEVVDRAWVTYSNRAKQQEVDVPDDMLKRHGAVSEAVVRAMAEGGADDAHVCMAVSGIAGPGGGAPEKPVGTVWIAVAIAGQGTITQCLHLDGARHEIQSRSVLAALNLLLTAVDKFHCSA